MENNGLFHFIKSDKPNPQNMWISRVKMAEISVGACGVRGLIHRQPFNHSFKTAWYF
jgi:hypothetical protein